MNQDTKSFLESEGLPEHVCLLLHLYGVVTMKDLLDFGEADIQEIEDLIKEGTIGGQIDLASKANRKKYLDGELCEFSTFSFRRMDRKKLLKLADSAKISLEQKQMLAEKKHREASGRDRNRKAQSPLDSQQDSLNTSDTSAFDDSAQGSASGSASGSTATNKVGSLTEMLV